MATNYWRGGSAAVAQVTSWAFGGTYLAAETVTVTIGSKAYTYTLTSGTIATFLPLLATALGALSSTVYPEFAEITWSSDATHLIATSRTVGYPFTAVVTISSASGTVGAATNTTSNSGPSVWSTAKNWSTGFAPQSSITAPVQAAASASNGGTLVDTTTYYWVVTAVDANGGETVKSNERSLVIAAPNQTANLSWAAPVEGAAAVTSYKVYRTTSSGTYGATSLRATVAGGSTLSYIDTGGGLSTGTPPGSSTALGDDVVISDPTFPILYDLDQHAYTIKSFVMTARFEGSDTSRGTLGLPEINRNGNAYPEYRPQYLQIGITQSGKAKIGTGQGGGSGRVKIDLGSVAGTVEVHTTGSSGDGWPAVMLKGSSASNILSVLGGSAGIALMPGETANFSGGVTLGPGATVTTGTGVTLATVVNDSGTLEINGAVGTSLTQNGGTTAIYGTGAVAQLSLSGGGYVNYSTTGTLGGNTTVDGSVLDFGQDQSAKTVTNPITVRGGGQVLDPLKIIVSLVVSSPDGTGQVLWGPSWTLTRS